MIDKFKNFLTEGYTQDDFTSELEEYNEDIEDVQIERRYSAQQKNVVNLIEPITKVESEKIMNKVKKGELCFINYEKVDDMERSSIEAQIKGALFALDGEYICSSEKTAVCLPKQYDGIKV